MPLSPGSTYARGAGGCQPAPARPRARAFASVSRRARSKLTPSVLPEVAERLAPRSALVATFAIATFLNICVTSSYESTVGPVGDALERAPEQVHRAAAAGDEADAHLDEPGVRLRRRLQRAGAEAAARARRRGASAVAAPMKNLRVVGCDTTKSPYRAPLYQGPPAWMLRLKWY